MYVKMYITRHRDILYSVTDINLLFWNDCNIQIYMLVFGKKGFLFLMHQVENSRIVLFINP